MITAELAKHPRSIGAKRVISICTYAAKAVFFLTIADHPARLRLDAMESAKQLLDLKFPPGNRLESLKGDLTGYHSIRINDQFRIIFRWIEGDIRDVEITDYH